MGDTGNFLLDGIRVVEVGTFIAGPAAATVMTDFGAEVTKIEAPGIGDPYRYLHTIKPMPESEQDYCWILDGRNKKSVVVNLKSEAGHEIVLKLSRDADVFLTNFHPSVLNDLKLTYEDVKAVNERIIYAHATGYGEVGPEAEKPGYDMTAWWAHSGLMNLIRSADSEPSLSVAGMGDHPTAMSLFGAIMMGLYARERTGKGRKVSTSLLANGVWANGCFIQSALCGAKPFIHQRRDEADNAMVNHYVTRDGKRFIITGIRGNVDFEAACHAIDRVDLITDERFAEPEQRYPNMRELIAIFDAAFLTKDMAEWVMLFKTHELTFAPVHDYTDLPNDEQLHANGILVDLDHPRFGKLKTISSPLNASDTEKVTPTAAPTLGQHTREVLTALGYSDQEIDALSEQGVVACEC